ncbi:hypothetical protein, partial [Pseudonocardia sp. TRM90224]|uniref:hypothetical protein n=1 Tax=Pseudonocardia sp. TRM90224 TaxID=2812678 RepID=UPI001E2DB61B
MYQHIERDGEGFGPAVLADVSCVRLRLRQPVRDRALAVLRWALGLAGCVVVMWMGSALLATPASAAAAPVLSASQGLVKGGKERPAGVRFAGMESGDGGDGGNGGEDSQSDGGEQNDSSADDSGNDSGNDSGDDSGNDNAGNDDSGNNESSDNPDDNNSGDNAGDSNSREGYSGDDTSRAEKSDADNSIDDDGTRGSRDDDSRRDDSAESSKRDFDGSDEDRSATENDRWNRSSEKQDTDEQSGASESAERDRKDAPENDATENDVTEKDAAEKDAAENDTTDSRQASDDGWDGTQGEDAASEKVAEFAEKVRATAKEWGREQSGSDTDGTNEDGADGDAADEDRAAEIAEYAGQFGEELADKIRERVATDLPKWVRDNGDNGDGGDDVIQLPEVVDGSHNGADIAEGIRERITTELRERLGDEIADKVNENWDSGKDERAARLTPGSDSAQLGAEKVDPAALPVEGSVDALCSAHGECTDAESMRDRFASTTSARGPPRDVDDHSGDNRKGDDRDRWDGDAEQVEKALDGRIEKDRSAAELEESRKQAASGGITADELAERETAHQELAAQADADKAELSQDRAELIDRVVDGHRDVSTREAALDAEREQVAAGAATADDYERNAAQLEKDKQKLYKDTGELREAAGRDRPRTPGHASDEGSAAGCGKSGAFVECGSVTETADGDQERDRCVALAGVSSGCGASTGSGDSKGSASCVLTGADQGCGSNTSKGEVTASAWCSTGEGDCQQSSSAGERGAEMACETDAGTCRGSTSGPAQDDPGQKKKDAVLASDEQSGRAAASAQCTAATGCEVTGSIDLTTRAVRAEAAVDCRTSGACTGSANTDTGSDTKAAADTAANTAAASCTVSSGDCAARSGTRTADIRNGKAGTSAASGTVDCGKATGCAGTANTTTGGKVTSQPVTTDTATVAAAVRETSASANCTAGAGGCSAESGSTVGNTARNGSAAKKAAKQPAIRTLTASSTASAAVDCAAAACKGTGSTATSGAASGDIVGVRDSSGSATCAANGAGGRCAADSGSKVTDRAAAKVVQAGGVVPVSGPVSVSTASATIECTSGRTGCGGTAASATSARDTAVTPEARGTSVTAACDVTGGSCKGATKSAASSAPDHVVIDPATGKPAEGQPLTGPSSTSSATANLDCPKGCTGAVTTTATGTDAAVGGPRTSTGTA